MTGKRSTPGYADLVRTHAREARGHEQISRLAAAAGLLAAMAWAYTTGQRPLLVVGLAAAAVAVIAWAVAQHARYGRAAVERFVEHPDQVTSIEEVHRARAVFLRLRRKTGETLDLKVPARQASAIAGQLKAHCRFAALHVKSA
jgi:hypothetical protein